MAQCTKPDLTHHTRKITTLKYIDNKKKDKILFKHHAEMCNSFAHPIRLETVHHLKNKGSELSFGKIADLIGVGKSTLARHLSIMLTNGILIQRKEGVNVFYKMSSDKITTACGLIREVLITV